MTGDDCGAQICEPTRIAEGYTLELRCPEEDPVPPDVWSAMKCCIDDLDSADKAAEESLAVSSYGQHYAAADIAFRNQHTPQFSIEDYSAFSEAMHDYQQSLDGKDASTFVENLDETQVRKLADQFGTATAAIVRWDLQAPEHKKKACEISANMEEEIEQARTVMQHSAGALGDQIAAKISSSRDRLIGAEWVEQGPIWIDPDLDSNQRLSVQQFQYAYNAPYSSKLQQQFSNGLVHLRDWLIERIESKKLFADCKLRQDVLSIEIPQGRQPNQAAILQAAYKLLEALLRFLIDCICAALNPPCAPCEDDAVKLACMQVDDCEVIRICNLERTYVLSGPAMRYWMPFLRCIGEFFERACCETEFRIDPPRSKYDKEWQHNKWQYGRHQQYMSQLAPTYRHIEGMPQLQTLFKIANVDENTVRSAVNLGGNLTAGAALAKGIDTQGFEIDLPGKADQLAEGAITTLIQHPNARELLVGDLEQTISALRVRVDDVETKDEKFGDYVDERISSKLGNINRAIDRRLTESALKKTSAINDIHSRIEKLEKLFDEYGGKS